jgi:biopolymer transport protein ExbD
MLMRGLSIAVLLVACGKTDKEAPKETPPTPPAPPPAQTAKIDAAAAPAPSPCADRAAALGKRLSELAAATPGFMPMQKDINAPESAAGKPVAKRGFVIGVGKDGKMYAQGQRFKDIKEVGQYLDAMNKSALEKYLLAGGSSKDAKFPIYIWADRDTPAAKVADVLTAAEGAGMHWELGLLVAGKAAAPAGDAKPSDAIAAIAAKMPASEPEATKYLVDELKKGLGDTCSAIITPLATASMEGVPGKDSDKLVKEVPAGLVKCECKLPNVDVFEWGMHQWLGAAAPPLALVDMPKIAKGEKQSIGKLVK